MLSLWLSFSLVLKFAFWKSHIFRKLLSSALDGGVDGEGEDEENEAVEDAQDGKATVLWVVLRTWKDQLWTPQVNKNKLF